MDEPDCIATVYLFRSDGAVLLQHRDDKPGLRHANMWVPPGGHANPGESALLCARREFHEETCYLCGELHFLTVIPMTAEGVPASSQMPGDSKNEGRWRPFHLHVFCSLYDGKQTITCREGQALEFIPRQLATSLAVPTFVIPLWDEAWEMIQASGAIILS